MFEQIKKIYSDNPDEPFIGRDSLICKITVFWLAMPIIRLMQRLKIKISPNIITITSIAFILLAGYLFFINELLFGAICYFIYLLGDEVDGKWARLTKKTSNMGRNLDYFGSVIGNFLMFFGLWYSQFYLKNIWLIGLSLILAYYVLVILLVTLVKEQYYTTMFPKISSYYSLQEEGFAIFFIAPFFNITLVLFPILIFLQLLTFIVLFVRQKERPDIKERFFKRLLKL